MKFLEGFAIILCIITQSLSDDSIQDVFFVKPGGQPTVYEKTLNSYTCTFGYQAQGGTHEQWQVSMEKVDDGQSLLCTIQRGAASYLFFQTFNMTLSGPEVSLQEGYAYSAGSTNLLEEEYEMDSKANIIKAVPGKFKNHLETIILKAALGKTEL